MELCLWSGKQWPKREPILPHHEVGFGPKMSRNQNSNVRLPTFPHRHFCDAWNKTKIEIIFTWKWIVFVVQKWCLYQVNFKLLKRKIDSFCYSINNFFSSTGTTVYFCIIKWVIISRKLSHDREKWVRILLVWFAFFKVY